MSHSSEEVLSIINNVKVKKTEGSLYMMGSRMAWMLSSRDSFSISHNYADIKVQKISPDSKEKVQLQIIMHNSSACTFQFVNPKGRPAQVNDRLIVKELLQQLLPKFRNKINSELEEKNRMLQENPELFQLYKDLVVSQVMVPDEFWSAHSQKSLTSESVSSQNVGISAAFLADIKPQPDGSNGLKYNLTTDIIESIFRTYPSVRKKHLENVPDNYSEAEFWTRFFQSHYFHRDRINFSSKDMFADCAKTDEEAIREEVTSTIGDPLLDLNRMVELPSDEGYGISIEKSSTANPANASLIRRFNQLSTNVMKATSSNKRSFNSLDTTDSLSAIQKNSAESDSSENKRARLQEKVTLEDLSASSLDSHCSSLKLTKSHRYLHGPTPIIATPYNSTCDLLSASTDTLQDIQCWDPRLKQVINSTQAVNALSELSPGGALMQGCTQQQLHQMVPKDIQIELKQLYSACCELLRHFWSCFPVSNKHLEEKLIRMRDNLERFNQTKIRQFSEKLKKHHYNVNLVGHVEEMLETATNKFTVWQAKKSNRR